MTTTIGIIADDFTGANDSGVRLAQKGLRSKVIFSSAGREEAEQQPEIDVWIVDTNSRAMAPEDAYEQVAREITALKKRGVELFYKKVDSTLRGSVAAELKAMQDAAELDVIFIAPAFPSMGRTVDDGHLYVNGKPITATEFARDPKTPVLHDYLPDLLAMDGVEIRVLDRELLYKGDVAAWVQQQVQDGVKWIVCDTLEEQDFTELAELEAKLDMTIGWAGSAGLINHLYEPQTTGGEAKGLSGDIDKVLVVSGSLSEKTQQQLEKLSSRPATRIIEIDPLELLTSSAQSKAAVADSLAEAGNWDSAAIYVGASQENRDKVKAWSAAHGKTAEDAAQGISHGLGHLVKTAMDSSNFDAIIMTGGDTAKEVCQVLGILDMELKFEVEAGLPLGLVNWQAKELAVVTKAGGFGNADSLVNTVEYLKGAGTHVNN